jgi:hypothetical protein
MSLAEHQNSARRTAENSMAGREVEEHQSQGVFGFIRQQRVISFSFPLGKRRTQMAVIPSTQETKAGGSQVQGQSELHSKTEDSGLKGKKKKSTTH